MTNTATRRARIKAAYTEIKGGFVAPCIECGDLTDASTSGLVGSVHYENESICSDCYLRLRKTP